MTRLVVCCVALSLVAADWPQFRGPHGSGVADDQKPPVKFGAKENLAWKVEVPPGASSPIVVGDKVILTAFDDGKLFTICHSRTDGKELWRADAKAKKIEDFHPVEGSPAASTPASDGKHVVSYFGSCGLICYDLEGKEQWRFDLPTAETDGRFGTGTSPIIADGLVFLARDLAKDSAVYAVDLATGSQKWKAERPKARTAYGTPVVWDDGGKKVLAVVGMRVMTAYDAKTGAELWTVNRLSTAACATPVLAGESLVYAAGGPGGAEFKMPTFDDLLKQADEEKLGHLTKAGVDKTMLKGFFDNQDTNKDGKLTREEWDGNVKMFMEGGEDRAVAIKSGGKGEVAWSHKKGLPYVSSPIVYRDRFYMLKDGPLLTCLDAKTGKVVYEQERVKGGPRYYASPVAANGHIYIASLDGTVAVIAAGEDTPDVVYSTKLAEPVRATPAIAHDTLYVRSDKFLYAFRSR
ncbi:MAG TPA: PQQ-binding-like beta-propeller repeat protein [Gemmata sp.]|nr:PQQ-binding-like beta-propeller repeat protein [Gemmata sp.]